jgi:hypothetical protein
VLSNWLARLTVNQVLLGLGVRVPPPQHYTLLVQRIEHLTTDQEIGVRISYGVLKGTLAQLVEHRTENPGVPSSILGGTTKCFLSSVG